MSTPSGIRLRAFEIDYVSDWTRAAQAIRNEYEALAETGWDAFIESRGVLDEDDDSWWQFDKPTRALAVEVGVRLRELSEWIRLGKKANYFDPGLQTEVESDDFELFLAPMPLWDRLRGGHLYREEFHVGQSQQQFDQELSRAFDSTSVERDLYVRLLLFTAETDWHDALERVSDLQQALRRDPDRTFHPQVMDEVSWALSGSESAVRRGVPSDWRSDPLGGADEIAVRRQQELDSVRDRIVMLMPLSDFAAVPAKRFGRQFPFVD